MIFVPNVAINYGVVIDPKAYRKSILKDRTSFPRLWLVDSELPLSL